MCAGRFGRRCQLEYLRDIPVWDCTTRPGVEFDSKKEQFPLVERTKGDQGTLLGFLRSDFASFFPLGRATLNLAVLCFLLVDMSDP